jgi:hypothetical protein
MGAVMVAGCRNKSGSGDTGSELGGGICHTPELDLGWYCIDYSGSDWTAEDGEADCLDSYDDGEWAPSGTCEAGSVGTCDIDLETDGAVIVHMYGLETPVAEAACESLIGGDWTAP